MALSITIMMMMMTATATATATSAKEEYDDDENVCCHKINERHLENGRIKKQRCVVCKNEFAVLCFERVGASRQPFHTRKGGLNDWAFEYNDWLLFLSERHLQISQI